MTFRIWHRFTYIPFQERYDQGYGNYDYEPHSGDPQADLEYDRMHSGYVRIPDSVKNFLTYLRTAIEEGQLFELQNLYENT